MSRKRLCIVLGGHWEAQMGGAQYQARCLVEALVGRADFETFYLAHVVPQRLERDGYRIVRFGPANPRRRAPMLAQLVYLYRELQRLKPQVVYQRCLMPYTGVCALYCARHGARLVFHIASDEDVRRPKGLHWWNPRRSFRWLLRRIAEYGLRRADRIVAQTRDQADVLKAEYGLDVTAVIPNFHPVPDEPVSRAEGAQERLRVVWVANFKPIKNPEVFVGLAEAFAHRDDVRFVMIGRGGDESRYAQLHERIRSAPNLEYKGELPLEEVNREIAASDLLVNTSTAEGFPNTFIQAWLRGVPVLSLNVNPDGCLTEAGAGVLAGSPERLRAELAGLLADRDALRRHGHLACEYARARHHPANAQKLIDLLSAGGD